MIAFLWAIPSYFLHVLVHELAHAAVAWSAGVGARISILPSRVNGRVYFGRTTFDEPLPADVVGLCAVAPLVAELTWFIGAAAALALVHVPRWAEMMLAIEVAFATVDAGVWLFGYALNRPGTDGARLRAIGSR